MPLDLALNMRAMRSMLFLFVLVSTPQVAISAAASSCSCENGKAKLWGPGGPHTALVPAATLFNKVNPSMPQIEICWGPEQAWQAAALQCSAGLFTASEQQMAGFLRVYSSITDKSMVTPVSMHAAVLIVLAGNPKRITNLADVVDREDLRVVVNDGNFVGTLTSGTAVWEDMVGRMDSVSAIGKFHSKIVAYAGGSGKAKDMLLNGAADLWVSWFDWYVANPSNFSYVPIEPTYAIMRPLSIAVTNHSSAGADIVHRFVNFLLTDSRANSAMEQAGFFKVRSHQATTQNSMLDQDKTTSETTSLQGEPRKPEDDPRRGDGGGPAHGVSMPPWLRGSTPTRYFLTCLIAYTISYVLGTRHASEMRDWNMSPLYVRFVSNCCLALAFASACLVAGSLLEVEVKDPWHTFIPSLTVVFGLVSQNSLKDLVAGLIIIFSQVLQVGDRIHIDKINARVIEVGFFQTRLYNNANEGFSVPNSAVVGKALHNESRNYRRSEQGMRRMSIHVYVSALANLEEAHAILLSVAKYMDEWMQTKNSDPSHKTFASGGTCTLAEDHMRLYGHSLEEDQRKNPSTVYIVGQSEMGYFELELRVWCTEKLQYPVKEQGFKRAIKALQDANVPLCVPSAIPRVR